MNIKYDKIGTGYNLTRKADPYLADRLFCLLEAKQDKRYLDIGCGTGNYTCALADKGLHLTGVDPSEKMLIEAKARNENITWIKGTAEEIPVGDNAFDGIIATLTIHHWSDLKLAFAELARVLARDGRIVLFTSTPEQMKGYWLYHYFPNMLHNSIVQMPSLMDIQNAIQGTDLKIKEVEKYFVSDNLEDCFLYVGKNDPEHYFDEHIRHGISSFSSLANLDEVEQGLKKLRSDINSGEFEMIRKKFENDLGDYMFIAVNKIS